MAGRRSILLLLAGTALVLSACAGSGPQTSLEPQGQFARDIDGLWDLVFWMAVAVFVVVTAAYIYALVRFRERKDDDRRPVQVRSTSRPTLRWT